MKIGDMDEEHITIVRLIYGRHGGSIDRDDALARWMDRAMLAFYAQRNGTILSRDHAAEIALKSAAKHKRDDDSERFPPSWVIDAVRDAYAMGTIAQKPPQPVAQPGLVHPDEPITDDQIREIYNAAAAALGNPSWTPPPTPEEMANARARLQRMLTSEG